MCVCVCVWIKQLIPKPPERNILSARFSFPVSLWQSETEKNEREGGPVAPETEDTAALFENVYGVLPISLSLSLSLWPGPSLSPFLLLLSQI